MLKYSENGQFTLEISLVLPVTAFNLFKNSLQSSWSLKKQLQIDNQYK